MANHQRHSGFTLIELMIVVAILAILASIAMAAYQNYTIRAQVNAGLSDIAGGKTAFESLVVANSLTTFDVTDIGLQTSTTRCSEITMEPGADGFIRCELAGHPRIAGVELTIDRDDETDLWRCTIPIDDQYRPDGCDQN
ncbi:pilin [Wenzhouxiangella sp. AB-CW3]|uniref:pilin n=1 Tax=Wenzhouxiangella sp. AB-CW3 TaxID=2771012 RepID=UPI00168BB87F|nr:pilin [Wenzhouxiangella sp. AB-CW3]QOC23444.1 pilin [Wenzhouxiangella sp. AB-CW3]